MKRLLFQAVFLATGMIMGVYASGDVGLDLMCGALVAVCCAAVGEYASGSWLAMALIVMLDCGACLVPAWYLMLPIAAFNAASSSAGVDGSRFLQALVPRWLWLLPMTIVIFRSIGSHVPSDLSIIILMVLQTVLGFAAGLLCTRCANLAREVRTSPAKCGDCRIPAATRFAACARRSPKTTRIVRWPYARRRLPNARASHVRSMTMSATC